MNVKRPPKQILVKVLEKLLAHRAGLYAELLAVDRITPEQEQVFDQCLLLAVTRLGISIEVHDPAHGTVELFRRGSTEKKRRWMRSHEWNACRKVKFEHLRFVDEIPQAFIDEARKPKVRKPRTAAQAAGTLRKMLRREKYGPPPRRLCAGENE